MSALALGAARSCKTCGGIIAYYPTKDGAPIALDVAESKNGPLVLEIDLADVSRTFAREMRAGEDEGRRFTPHASTCGAAR